MAKRSPILFSGILVGLAGLCLYFLVPRKETLREVQSPLTASIADSVPDSVIADIDRAYDREKLKEFTQPLLTVRHVASKGHDQVRQYLIDFFKQRQYHVEVDDFDAKMPNGTAFVGTNVIASTKRPGPRTRRVILACHWDSKYYANFDFIGAIDSAIPCGMLLWLADCFQQTFVDSENARLLEQADVAVEFLFFDGEEAVEEWTATDSIYGARHLASRWQREGKLATIDLLVLFDLIGAKNSQFYSFFGNTLGSFKSLGDAETRLRRLWKKTGRLFDSPPQSARVMIEDDHTPFLRRNVPILHVIPAPFPKVWHTKDDTVANIDWPTVDKMTKIFAVFTARHVNALILSGDFLVNTLINFKMSQ